MDLTGQRYGRLLVLSFSHIGNHNRRFWNCLCECGVTKKVPMPSLRRGKSQSCGCIKHELDLIRRKTHGFTAERKKDRTYNSWMSMKSRCINPNESGYENYGGRGIKVCDRWLGEEGFNNFLTDMGERPPNTTIDRFPDVNGNYEPSNCRWGTDDQQSRNRRNNRVIEYFGISMPLCEWAKLFKLTRGSMLSKYINRNGLDEAMAHYIKRLS